MAKQKSRIGRRHWQLVICLTLAKIGSISPLGAQWSSPSPQIDTTNISLFIDTNAEKEPVYQGPVFVDSLHRRVTLIDFSNTKFRLQASELLTTLVKTGDLSRFDVVYLPWHQLQIVLMQQYLRQPDSLHMDYLRVAWKDDIEFPETFFLSMRDFQKKQPGVLEKIRFESLSYGADFLDNENESGGQENSEMLSYPHQEYEWALAVALNSLFPPDKTVGLQTDTFDGVVIPTTIRTQVEATKAMVSLAMWDRVWQDRFGVQSNDRSTESSESSDESSSSEFEIDPAFYNVPTITSIRDSMPFIAKDLENWIPTENREMFRQLMPFFGRVQELELELSDYATSTFNTNKILIHQIPSAKEVVQSVMNRGSRNGYESFIYRDYQIQTISKEKGRVLVLLDDYRECIDRSRYLLNSMPSLLSGLLNTGVKKDSVLRVFLFPEDPFYPIEITPELISNKNDSMSMGRNLKVNPTLFIFATDTADTSNETAVIDQPFGMETELGYSAHPIVLLKRLSRYEITDRLLVGTVFLSLPLEDGISPSSDTEMAEIMDDYGRYSSRKSNFLRGYNAAFEMNYVYGLNRLKLGELNSVLRSEGLSEIGMIQSQGISLGVSYTSGGKEGAKRMIKNDRLVITQSSPLVNPNMRSTYMLWYDENQISMGRHFTLGVGVYTGYVRHELKNFTGVSGGFINQDQPSFKVANPAYIYGFSVTPALRFGNFYARGSAGYGWDFGKKTWNYQGSAMNSKGGMKNTGLFMSAEIGYCYRFDFASKDDDVVADYSSEAGTKSNKRRVVR
ncbi:MAG: autotransporter outer membrane beta-barrel domain-containing protein [Bacteroidetes bacterium]|nr:autotransporter outer membrane beta-barrel domain-containing protein [Bacteroidota bacterium]MDA1225227.1 autotransporter outer membrane beta-barrel domain-containing protein [Bacteroidota bacterium]